jgi:hypothetical protein
MIILRRGKRRARWTGFCKEHQGWAGLSELLSNLSQPEVESPVQQNGEKREVGRPVEDRSAEHEQMRDRFESIVHTLRANLPANKIKRRVIAAEYHRLGEKIAESTVTKRVQLLYGQEMRVEDAVALVLEKSVKIII